MTNESFLIAYRKTAIIEGGYANDPQDNGGETYAGLTRKNEPNWKGWAIIDSIKKRVGTKAENIDREASKSPELATLVLEAYKLLYWDSLSLDILKNQEIKNELYDTGVNMGIGTAGRFFQRVLNALNKNQLLFPDLEVDGKIGPRTIAACNAMTDSDQKLVYKFLNHLQGARYIEITENNHTQEKFIRSWGSRT